MTRKRFLITTALEESWRDDGPALFLGEWCRIFGRAQRWSRMDAEVLPYHWNDRARLLADYDYLQDFHERLLRDLTPQLNRIHGVDHGPRYWRILIGPWLALFSEALFDRWACLQQAASRYEIHQTLVLTGQDESLVPNDMDHFERLLSGDDWNHHVCAAIIRRFTGIPFVEQVRRTPPDVSKAAPIPWKRWAKRTLATWYARAASILIQDDDAFFLSTYLPPREEMKLNWLLGQAPQLWRSAPPVSASVDVERRRWSVSGANRTPFEACARALIPQQIPTVYLEGYERLVRQADRLPWPKRPRVIWTSNSHIGDDVFKAWTAGKVENGSPLVIGQHGGHYGIGRWSTNERHEMMICDRYLSWGWTEAGQTNVIPLGQLKAKRPLGVRHAEQPDALLVTCVHPRYSYLLYSTPVASQWLDYFADQFKFVEGLPKSIRSALTVRLYPDDNGWDQAGRWRERFPDLRLDDGRSSMNDLIRRSRLYISTYNATTFLESLAMNVPTIIYWNPRCWELRDSALPYFDDLKRAGIFHDTPESAARRVAEIWGDVDAWWRDQSVREARERFQERYCRLPNDIVGEAAAALRTVMR